MLAGTPIGLGDSTRVSALVICLLLLAAALLAPGAASSEPALANAKKGKRVIVRPKAGARVRRHPVKVVVKGRDGLFDVKARLNGKKITEAFGRTHKGKRKARIARSHGLRRGRNVLRVKARRRIGQRRRKAKVAFFVRHKRPLAGAGSDRRIVEGERFRLRGRALSYPRKPRVRQNRRIKYRWRITKAPRQSEFRDEARAGSARLAGKPLSKPTARHPRFTPDIRGQYRFKLRITDGKRSSSDEVRLNAVPGTPFVPVQTVSTSRYPAPAIKVGNTPYRAPDPDLNLTSWMQVVVLDRATLGLVSNKTYTCGEHITENCRPEASQVAADLSKLDDTKLVIAASQGDRNDFLPPASYPQALAPIGFPKLDPRPFEDAHAGTVSAIGVPGLPAGQADVRIDLDGPRGIGNMDGYLTPDQFYNYTWLPKERPLYDTRESSTIDRFLVGNVMEIEGRKIESRALGEAGIFHVVVMDGLTGKLVDNKTYATNCFDSTGCSENAVINTSFTLEAVTPGQLVFITSTVTGPDYQPVDPKTPTEAWNRLASAIAKLGGSRHTFFEATAKKGARYTLVGWRGAGETNGEESTSVKNAVPGAGRLQGTLVRDHMSQFRPAVTSVGDAPNETLMQLVLKPEGPWPLDRNTEAQYAIRWIGSQNKKLGRDVRSAYWIQDGDEAWWDDRAGEVAALEYPGLLVPNGFSKENFELAQAELVQEIKWVGAVRDYLDDLSKPFSTDALQTFKNLDAIHDAVNSELKPPDGKTFALVSAIVRETAGAIGAFGGPPGEALAEVFQVTIDIIGQDQNGSDISDINVRASQLEANLSDRLQNAQSTIARIGDIIVADYSKLATVGTNAKCAPGPNCPVDWQFTGEDKQVAASAVYKGIETLFVEGFMSLAFPAYVLGPSQQTPRNARDYPCGAEIYYPFRNEPDNGQAAVRRGPSVYDIYALGNVSVLSATNYIPAVPPAGTLNRPPAGTLNRMFSPGSSSLDPKDGGLGIYSPDFMLEANQGRGDYNDLNKPGLPFVCGGPPWGNR